MKSRRKGISSIFSSLIVTLITLSLAVPLFLYFNSLHNTALSTLGQSFSRLNNATMTQLSVIRVGEDSNQTYLYNYGSAPIDISSVIVNKTVYSVGFVLKPSQVVPLSQIIKENISLAETTIIIEANGNYYQI